MLQPELEKRFGRYLQRLALGQYLDASADGSLHYLINWVENGVHSVQVFAINMWGDSNPCPFDFTRSEPVAPQNLQLIQ